MIIAVFRNRVNAQAQKEFDRLYSEMSTHINKIPGYISHKSFASDDGEQVVIVEFENKEALEAWDIHPEHKKAKERGKQEIFDKYDVAVATIFERHTKD